MSKRTYTAFYQDDHSIIIYRSKGDDGTLDRLPDGAKPLSDRRSSYFRTDGGDRFEFAWFKTNQGLTIIVQADGVRPSSSPASLPAS